MPYSKFFFRSDQKKIPTLVSLGILILIIIVMTRFFSAAPLQSRASKKVLRQVQVFNVSTTTADVFWETDAAEAGWVVFGEAPNRIDKTAIDERDLTAKKKSYYFHLARVSDLKPKQNYYFKIVSNNQVVTQSSGEAFSFTTLDETKKGKGTRSLYGKVVRGDGFPVDGGVVIVTLPNGSLYGTLTKVTGEWLIVLSDSQISPDRRVTMVIYGEDKKKTTVGGKMQDMSPVSQTLVLGQDYDLSLKEEVLSAQSKPASNKTREVDIVLPGEGMVVPGQIPIVKGVAPPGAELIISIHSPVEYSFRAKAGKDGIWKVDVPQNLAPGEHTISVKTKNSKGEEITIERKFFIAKSGEQVLGEATASATPTVTPQLSASPTPTVIPTNAISPTEILTKTPPRSGSNSGAVFSLISGGFIILGLGILFVF